MCVIVACESTRPPKDVLEQCEESNGDGAGIAWIDGDSVRFKKGVDLSADEVFEMTESLPLPYVVHFRVTSVGETRDELCHPFPVTASSPLDTEGEAPAVLFHNGTWRDWDDALWQLMLNNRDLVTEDVWSDSRAMAILHHELGRDAFENSKLDIGGRDRVCTLDPENGIDRIKGRWYYSVRPNERTNEVYENEESGKWDAGLVFSNNYWKPRTKKKNRKKSTNKNRSSKRYNYGSGGSSKKKRVGRGRSTTGMGGYVGHRSTSRTRGRGGSNSTETPHHNDRINEKKQEHSQYPSGQYEYRSKEEIEEEVNSLRRIAANVREE